MEYEILPVGSRVCVTSYGPFRGLRGTISVVDTIATDQEAEQTFCFYRIALEGSYVPEPIWFESKEVEATGPASLQTDALN